MDRNEDAIRVLVCGPLTFENQEAFDLVLDKAWRRRAIEAVVHWGGPGVPALASRWCRRSGTPEVLVELDERPPERTSFEYENRRVLKRGKPRAIIVFPGKSHRVEQLLEMVSVEMPVWRPFRS